MKEHHLQHEIVKWFSQTYPQYYGCLWATFNEDSKHKSSSGMITGVSDLILFLHGKFAGIEIKAPGSRHAADHIRNQIAWGVNIIQNGGYYLISANEIEIKNFINCIVQGKTPDNNYPTELNSKTIKF